MNQINNPIIKNWTTEKDKEILTKEVIIKKENIIHTDPNVIDKLDKIYNSIQNLNVKSELKQISYSIARFREDIRNLDSNNKISADMILTNIDKLNDELHNLIHSLYKLSKVNDDIIKQLYKEYDTITELLYYVQDITHKLFISQANYEQLNQKVDDLYDGIKHIETKIDTLTILIEKNQNKQNIWNRIITWVKNWINRFLRKQ